MGSDTLPLFEYPLSRNRDPVTSFKAADKLAKSGKYLTQKEAVLEALRRNNGATSAELAAYMGVDRYLTARRLPDLERDALVTKGLERECKVTEDACVTWWLVTADNNKDKGT